MRSDALLLVLDQGTTSTRAAVMGAGGELGPFARRKLPQSYPEPGWVEHDPRRIWEDALAVMREAVASAPGGVDAVRGIGITNQRETTVVWERASGRPVHPAIVWQDRRTSERCRALREGGAEPDVRRRTGLLLDPYFSASKVAWILDHVEGARAAAGRGELAFGTVDSWLLWKLTGGRVHATDATNASRTSLFHLREERWDEELLELFGVPATLLPEVRDTAGRFGDTDEELFGRPLPVAAMVGDQQSAAFGQAAFEPGTVKATYGTGAFLLENTGEEPVASEHRLLSTVAWRLGGRTTYALEGSIFSAGSALQWMQEELGLLDDPVESAAMAEAVPDTGGVYLVPGFTGLGAPHWDADARGALVGLTRDSGPRHLVRAGLESVAYQTRDLLEAMAADGAGRPVSLRVDGGLSANDWAMGFLADMLDLPVQRPEITETTTLGAGFLAGLATGVFDDLEAIAGRWREARRWEPAMEAERRERLYRGWRESVARVLGSPTPPPRPRPPASDGPGSR